MNTALPVRITGVMIQQASEVQMAFCTDLKSAVKKSVAWILGCSLEESENPDASLFVEGAVKKAPKLPIRTLQHPYRYSVEGGSTMARKVPVVCPKTLTVLTCLLSVGFQAFPKSVGVGLQHVWEWPFAGTGDMKENSC